METTCCSEGSRVSPFSFNFLASLINGNLQGWQSFVKRSPFNFLASLINGNCSFGPLEYSRGKFPFNFLASLINGNPGALGNPRNHEDLHLLTS